MPRHGSSYGGEMKIVGNDKIQQQIAVALASAKALNAEVPHMLFAGAAGCGKTTMAKRVAHLSGGDFISLLPDALKKMEDVLVLFEKLDDTGYNEFGKVVGKIKPAIIFIDEIHNLKPLQVQEWLGVAMENFSLESKDVNYLVPFFTLIGATTNDGLLSKPFLDRFKMRFIFKPYSFDESVAIVLVHAERLGLKITTGGAQSIAQRGRGIPRILVGYLERCRDIATVKGNIEITEAIAEETFHLLGVDKDGLRETEIRLMKALYEIDEPVGLENLAIIINEASKTILNSIEPFLIQKGLVIRSGQGRILTRLGKEYLENGGFFGKNKMKKLPTPAGYARR